MDSDVLEQLYRKYYGAALLYCTALCGDDQLAQDLTSEAFVKAYLSLPNDISSFRYWLMRVRRNLWIDHLRKHRRETSDEPLQYITDGITPETTYLRDERNRCLWKAIAELPPVDREMVTLHYFSGLSLLEVSQMIGKNYPSVRQRMVRVRQILKLKMEEQGYGYE